MPKWSLLWIKNLKVKPVDLLFNIYILHIRKKELSSIGQASKVLTMNYGSMDGQQAIEILLLK